MTVKTRFGGNKLVRDETLVRCEKNNIDVEFRILTGNEYLYELKKKLIEESEEVLLAKNDAELTDELADLIEVIDVLIEKAGVSRSDIERIRAEKNEERGSFKKGIFVEHFDVPHDSNWHDYCSESPDKYPILEDDIETK